MNNSGTQGTSGNGTSTMPVRPDVIADASASGLGTGFLTKDSVTNVYRPLNQGTELWAIARADVNEPEVLPDAIWKSLVPQGRSRSALGASTESTAALVQPVKLTP